MESEAFNNRFEVKTTDEGLAFYILTPQFMEDKPDIEDINDAFVKYELSKYDKRGR